MKLSSIIGSFSGNQNVFIAAVQKAKSIFIVNEKEDERADYTNIEGHLFEVRLDKDAKTHSVGADMLCKALVSAGRTLDDVEAEELSGTGITKLRNAWSRQTSKAAERKAKAEKKGRKA